MFTVVAWENNITVDGRGAFMGSGAAMESGAAMGSCAAIVSGAAMRVGCNGSGLLWEVGLL